MQELPGGFEMTVKGIQLKIFRITIHMSMNIFMH
jgi:hypothetical protein